MFLYVFANIGSGTSPVNTDRSFLYVNSNIVTTSGVVTYPIQDATPTRKTVMGTIEDQA